MIALVKQQPNTHLPIDEVMHGDALLVLRSLPSNSVDAIVSDPPAGINFMGKDFDKDRGGRTQWITWLSEIMREALRVTKPGGHALIWALPRTSHWTATALEDAEWEIREKCYHLFGSGFPKSKNLGNGIGSALKPAVEEWILCRKPLSESSLEANYRQWGTGGLNIDACRISHNEPLKITERTAPRYSGNTMNNGVRGGIQSTVASADPQGRFPSHLLLSHSLFCVPRGVKRVKNPSGENGTKRTKETGNTYSTGNMRAGITYRDPDGMEEVDDYDCDSSCPIRILNEQSGIRKSGGREHRNGKDEGSVFSFHRTEDQSRGYTDQGGASRYFQTFHYFSKASRAERNAGCEGLPERRSVDDDWVSESRKDAPSGGRTSPQSNHHPCVKSQQLMRWLCRLITPPDGIILDPFLGSGSTAIAAIHEGFHFIGIEQSEEYVNICKARIAHALMEVQPC